jgi:hypothetical protein
MYNAMVAYNTRRDILGVGNEEISWRFKCAAIYSFGDYGE